MALGEEKFSSHPNTLLSLEITFLSIRKKFRIYLMLAISKISNLTA
jgi:hypothetical protein